MNYLYIVLIIVVGCLIGAYGAILLKKGSAKLKLNLKALIKNKNLILGFVMYGLSSVLYILALRGAELSVLYPLVSLTYVFIAILSKLILKESMGRYKFIGMALIIFGVILIGIGRA